MNKILIAVLLVGLAVILIIYTFYLFEAYKNSWFPFIVYEINVPTNAVQVTGSTIDISPDERDILETIADNTAAANCCYYCSAQIKLPGNQIPIGNCNCNDCP